MTRYANQSGPLNMTVNLYSVSHEYFVKIHDTLIGSKLSLYFFM